MLYGCFHLKSPTIMSATAVVITNQRGYDNCSEGGFLGGKSCQDTPRTRSTLLIALKLRQCDSIVWVDERRGIKVARLSA